MDVLERNRLSSMASCLQLLLFIIISVNSVHTQSNTNHTAQPAQHQHKHVQLCRDRQGYFPPVLFVLHTCAMCLHYLLKEPRTAEYHVNVSYGVMLLQSSASGQWVMAEPGNQTAMDTVCHTLSSEDCRDWTACCQSASACCQKQIASRSSSQDGVDADDDNDTVDGEAEGCPMTWDGYSCVDKTPAGVTAVLQCPAFITRYTKENNGEARRQCWSNSTWYTNKLGLEWTDYTSCHKAEDHQTILTLKIVFKAISMALLFPSIAIYLKFRPLRSQLRIKLHINLFISLLLSAIFSLMWEILVIRDAIVSDQSDLFLKRHQGACKFLNITCRCLLMTTFFWMFCEGFYLTWLMVQSFRHLSSLRFFALFGWGSPVLFCVIYVIIRVASKDDTQCWVTSAGGVEWLLDGPTLACLAMNLIFLAAIMRVMLCQLRSHSQEGQLTVRRSLRALLILVPLFGLQEFCLLYRPRPSDPGFYAYEVVSAAVMNLQGAVVALIFCFFNGEVQGHLKDVYKRLQYKLKGGRGRSRQSLSLTSSLPSRPHRPSLASIDTAASVILAPLRLTATTDTNSDNGGENGSGGRGGCVDRGRRGRLPTLPDSIAEHDAESANAHSSEGSGDPHPADTEGNGSSSSTGLATNGFRPEEAEACNNTHQGDVQSRASVHDSRKKRGFVLFSFLKLWPKRPILNEKGTQRESQISDSDKFDNPAIVVSQHERSSQSHVPKPDEIIPTCSQTMDNSASALNTNTRYDISSHDIHNSRSSHSLIPVDDGASSKDSVYGEDGENRRLVQETLVDCHGKPRHVHPAHKCDGHWEGGRLSVRGLSSLSDDKRRLCSDAGSLQGSDSSASFSIYLPSDLYLEEEPNAAARSHGKLEDLSIKLSTEDRDPESLGAFYHVNEAFECDISTS